MSVCATCPAHINSEDSMSIVSGLIPQSRESQGSPKCKQQSVIAQRLDARSNKKVKISLKVELGRE